MDLLSNCSTLTHVLSFLKSDDVNACISVNQRINNVVANNWRYMQKKKVHMRIVQAGSNEEIVISFSETRLKSRSKELIVEENCPPIVINELKRHGHFINDKTALVYRIGSNEEGMNIVLQSLLPLIELSSLKLVFNNQPSTNVIDVLLNGFRNYYVGRCDELELYFENSAINPQILEISRILDCSLLTRVETEYYVSIGTHLEQYPLDQVSVMFKLLRDAWNAAQLCQLIQEWREGKRGIRCLCFEFDGDLSQQELDGWIEMCRMLDVQPEENINVCINNGYIPLWRACQHRFVLTRSCDNKMLEVGYGQHNDHFIIIQEVN